MYDSYVLYTYVRYYFVNSNPCVIFLFVHSDRERMWNISKNILEQIGFDYCNRKNETCFDYMAAIRFLGCNQHQSNLRHSKIFSYLKRINIDVNCKDMKYFGNSFRLKCSSGS